MTNGFWQRRSVLVTGATGFTAFWLIPELTRRGARVIAMARRAHEQSFPTGVLAIPGSVTDADLLRRVVSAHGVQTLFHLAGHTLLQGALEHPAATLDGNVRGTWNVLEAARIEGSCQVVLASTAKVYGDSAASPIAENAVFCSRDPYSASKCCAEIMTTTYAACYALPAVIIRAANLFGGADCNWSRVIPGLIRATLRGDRFVIRGTGRPVRDYLYIEDAVDGLLRVAEALSADRNLAGQAFNLGAGRGASVLELCDMVFRITGRADLPPAILGDVFGEAPEQVLNPEKARTVLQWSARHTLEHGLKKTVLWYQRNIDTARAADCAWDNRVEHIGV